MNDSSELKIFFWRHGVKPARAWWRIFQSLGAASWRAAKLVVSGRIRDRYEIRAFYRPRESYLHFDARSSSEKPQDRVYRELGEFCRDHGLETVLDVGCGTAFKLLKYFGDREILGLERPPVLEHLQATYPDRRFELADFNTVPQGSFDLVLSIDVIEHLLDPDDLLDYLEAIDFRYLALGTPDRARLGLASRLGPPANPHHIREWTQEELVSYVSRRFRVLRSRVVSRHEHYVICEKPSATRR